ncbi:MAG: hypothetical protein HQL47_03765 [Gammaproteobacteria bacterium]|nr:hypothetical protein [Gammaproteobacteria bacterium]
MAITGRRSEPLAEATTAPRCGNCGHFVGEALALEREFAGLNILSSALGSVRADSGWCRLLDRIQVARQGCEQHEFPGSSPPVHREIPVN